jgi:nicotinamidase-related amidase
VTAIDGIANHGSYDRNLLLDFVRPLPEINFEPAGIALLCVDMQYMDAHPDFGLFAAARERGLEAELGYYYGRLGKIVPNIARLQTAFRDAGMEVIHTKVAALTHDERDRSACNRLLGISSPAGTRESEILADLAPTADELVLTKTCSGVFNSHTNIDQLLRNLGIHTLIVVGVVTNNCVYMAAADASDRGYTVGVVEDGCAALSEQAHQFAITNLGDFYGKVLGTADVVAALEARSRTGVA